MPTKAVQMASNVTTSIQPYVYRSTFRKKQCADKDCAPMFTIRRRRLRRKWPRKSSRKRRSRKNSYPQNLKRQGGSFFRGERAGYIDENQLRWADQVDQRVSVGSGPGTVQSRVQTSIAVSVVEHHFRHGINLEEWPTLISAVAKCTSKQKNSSKQKCIIYQRINT